MKTALTIIIVVALIMVGCPAMAMPASPDVTVYFNVTKPDMSIITKLTDLSSGSPTSASAEFSAAGTGQTSGLIEGYIDSQAGWTGLSGTYLGSEGNFSSTFQVDALRTNSSDLTSTFLTRQDFTATGVGPLEFTITGEAAASSVTSTWDLGFHQEFLGTAQSVTGSAENRFEQRDNGGSLVGNPVNNQFTVTSTGGDSFTGFGEGGSNTGSTLSGFGLSSSWFYLDVHNGTSPSTTNVLMTTNQIEGETTTTWRDYLNNPNP